MYNCEKLILLSEMFYLDVTSQQIKKENKVAIERPAGTSNKVKRKDREFIIKQQMENFL